MRSPTSVAQLVPRVHTRLPTVALQARVRTTIVHTLGHKTHRPWSRAAPKMGSWEDEEEPEPDGTPPPPSRIPHPSSLSPARSRCGFSTHDDSACLLARSADEEDEEDSAFDGGESGRKKKSVSSAHVPISLFDQVLRGASEQVYDPHIGQYVEKTAIEADAKVDDEQTQSGVKFKARAGPFSCLRAPVRSARPPRHSLAHFRPSLAAQRMGRKSSLHSMGWIRTSIM